MLATVVYSIYFTLIREDFNFPFREKYENNIHFFTGRLSGSWNLNGRESNGLLWFSYEKSHPEPCLYCKEHGAPDHCIYAKREPEQATLKGMFG